MEEEGNAVSLNEPFKQDPGASASNPEPRSGGAIQKFKKKDKKKKNKKEF